MRRPRVVRPLAAAVAAAGCLLTAASPAAAQRRGGAAPSAPASAAAVSPSQYAALPWRHIGPEGNRFTSAAGIPGDPSTYYVGAASGGLY